MTKQIELNDFITSGLVFIVTYCIDLQISESKDVEVVGLYVVCEVLRGELRPHQVYDGVGVRVLR